MSLKSLMEKLPESRFMRVHRSFIGKKTKNPARAGFFVLQRLLVYHDLNSLKQFIVFAG
jgi:hypothetical protein